MQSILIYMNNETKDHISEFIIERVKKLMADNRIKSRRTLSQLSGHGEALVANLLKKRNIPTIVSLYDICDSFGITLEDFFRVDYSDDKTSATIMKLLSEKYSPEDLTLIYDLLKNVSRDKIVNLCASYSEYHNSKDKEKNDKGGMPL